MIKFLKARPTHTSFDAELNGLSESAFLFCLRPRILEIFGFQGRKIVQNWLALTLELLETGIEIEKSASMVTRSFFQAFIITYSFISSMYMVNKKMPYVDPVENRKNAGKCVGVKNHQFRQNLKTCFLT